MSTISTGWEGWHLTCGICALPVAEQSFINSAMLYFTVHRSINVSSDSNPYDERNENHYFSSTFTNITLTPLIGY